MGRIRSGKVAAQSLPIKEWWVMEALQTCHDVLWVNAERGDIRSLYKPEAEELMSKNPGKFKHVDTWKYDAQDGRWMRNNAGFRETL